MKKPDEILPAVPEKRLPAKPAKPPVKIKRFNLELRKILKNHNFSPLDKLVNSVFVKLEPELQADVCLQLISYLYAKPKHTGSPGVPSTNIQINNSPNKSVRARRDRPSASVTDLINIVSGAEEEEEESADDGGET
jgi:hypothetical protein